MIYTINVDTQQSPSSNLRQYTINCNELLRKGEIADVLTITPDSTTITRNIGIYQGETYILSTPTTETLTNIDIELFEGVNYIYVTDQNNIIISVSYLIKSDFTDTYPTKIEMTSAISQTATQIMTQVNLKVDETELGTQIVQNYESVKVAWNQISQYIQLGIINSNASFIIYDENNNKLITIDKDGQHFWNNNSNFANMGIETETSGTTTNKYIAFSVNFNSDESGYGSIPNGMAWGIRDTSTNTFTPLLYIKDFTAKGEGESSSGILSLAGCNLKLEDINSGILCHGIKIMNDLPYYGIVFYDTNTNTELLRIDPEDSRWGDYGTIRMLGGKIKFFQNTAGNKALGFGEYTSGSDTFYRTVITDASSGYTIVTDGSIYCNSVYQSSLESKKKNFEKLNNAINILKKIDIYKYNMQNENDEDKKHIGFVIGDKYNYSKEITSNENDGVDNYSFTSLCCKAIQEQQEQIEQMQNRIKELEEKVK